MHSRFSSIKKFILLFAAVSAVLTLALTGPFGSVLASSPYAPVFAQAFGTFGVNNGQFDGPGGIEVTPAGTIYVSDTNNDRIQVFNASGVYQSQISSGFYSPRGIAVDSYGNLYVADSGNNRIVKLNASGGLIKTWGAYGTGDGQFIEPYDVAVDAIHSVLYVADNRNHRVQKFSLDGQFQAKWGGPAAGSGDSDFNRPSGVAVDSAGNVFVADTNNNRIKKYSASGTLLEKFGASGSGDGQFTQPRGIAIDSEDYLYVLDTGNNRAQKFSTASKITFVAKWGSSGSGNGQFSVPYAVDANAADTVYVADTANNRVQRFEPDEAPTEMSLSNSSVKENLPAGTLVGAFSATDANAFDSFAYSFTTDCGGADNGYFYITGNKLYTLVSLNLTVKQTYGICVRVVDSGGMSYFQPFLISVENVNDPPVINNQSLPPISEAAPNGTLVGTLAASDPDANDSLHFSLTGGTGASAFSVDDQGRVAVSNSSLLNYETQSTLTLIVKVTDTAGASASATVTIYLTDANDAPVPTPFTTPIKLDENSPKGAKVGAVPLTSTDEDAGNKIDNWTIIGYDPVDVKDSIKFLIDPSFGGQYGLTTTEQTPFLYVANNAALDFERFPNIKLTIRATDDGFPKRYTDFVVPISLNDIDEPPNCSTGGYAVDFPEHSTVGQVNTGGTISVFDPEKKIQEWKIVGGDPIGANFTIIPAGFDKNNNSLAQLKMTTQVDLNYEVANPVITLIMDVKDSAGWQCKDGWWNPTEVKLKILISNINEDPYFEANPIRPNPAPSVDEDAVKDTVVSEIYGADPDAYGTRNTFIQYDITAGNPGPNNNKLFKINNVTYVLPDDPTQTVRTKGVIVVNNPTLLDFETVSSYNLTVQLRDGNWRMVTLNVPVTVNDKNDAPKISPQTFYASLNAPLNDFVGQLAVTDQDKNDTHTFALVPSGTGTDPFSVSPSGEIRVADPSQMTVDGTTFTVTVQSTDNGTPPKTGQGTVTVFVTSGNKPPMVENQTFSVNENTAQNTAVYKIVASDPESTPLTFSFVAGTGPNPFSINAADGTLTLTDPSVLNYESATIPTHTFDLTVSVVDSGTPKRTRNATITVIINDVNEAPALANQTIHINENTSAGTLVRKLEAVDPDFGTVLTYQVTSVTGNETVGNPFVLASDGSITVENADLMDAEKLSGPYVLTIDITDNGSPTITTTITATISVDNVNEPALVTMASSYSVNEDAWKGALIGTITAVDQDKPANSLVFHILSGNETGAFALDNTGRLTVAQDFKLNYEVKASYTLTFEVSDTSTAPAVAGPFQVTIAVNDKDEPPQIESSLYNFAVGDRMADTSIIIGKIKARDPENKQTVFEIISGNVDDTFVLTPEAKPDVDGSIIADFTLKTGKVIDFGKNQLYTLTVSASDGFNTAITHVTIVVNAHPDLALTVQAPDDALAGTRLKLQMQVKNTGYLKSKPYKLTITTPPNLTFDPVDSWLDCSLTAVNTVTCANNANGLAGQGYLNLPVYYKVSKSVTDRTQMQVSAVITPTDTDDMDANNNAWASTVIGWAQTVQLYNETFSGTPNVAAYWKTGSTVPGVATSPSGQKFVGPLASSTLTYTSELLPVHQSVTVSFDLYIIGDWAGNDPTAGIDQWGFKVGSKSLLATTFSNRSGLPQAYPGAYPGGSNPAMTGSKATNTLQYSKDATYHLTYTFSHSDPTLPLTFFASLPHPTGKSWGVDNVTITLSNQGSGWQVFLPVATK